MAIWEKDVAGRKSIASAYYSPATGWGPVTLVETDNSTDKFSPKIAINMNGMAIASWYEANTVAINTFTQGAGWGTPAGFDLFAANATTPKVVFDPQGNALAVYGATFTSSGIYARRYISGTGWDAAYTLISNGNDNAASEDIALDPHGNGIAVWAQWDGARYNIWSNDFR
jgi:hypothetical protein